MIKTIDAVQGFPPSFLVHQIVQALAFELIAIPDFPQAVTELSGFAVRSSLHRLQQGQCTIQITLPEHFHGFVLQLLFPVLQGVAILFHVASLRHHEFLLQSQGCSGVSFSPELFGLALPTQGLLIRGSFS